MTLRHGPAKRVGGTQSKVKSSRLFRFPFNVPSLAATTNGRAAQVGCGQGLERCFGLLSCICVFSSVSCPALFLNRFQYIFPRICQTVLLQTAAGFVGDGVFNRLSVHQLIDGSFEGACFAPQSQYFSQFVG